MRVDAESKGLDTIFFRIVTFEGSELAISDISSWCNTGAVKDAVNRLTSGAPHLFETITLPDKS